MKYTSRKTMLSFNYHKVGKGVAIMIKVALKNGYTVYGRLIEENSSSIILVAQRELIPEMRISHIRCSKDIGEKIVIDRNQVHMAEHISQPSGQLPRMCIPVIHAMNQRIFKGNAAFCFLCVLPARLQKSVHIVQLFF